MLVDPVGNTFTYTMVKGEEDDDNTYFRIEDDNLIIRSSPNIKIKGAYKVRLKTTDSDGLSHEQSMTLRVTDINESHHH